MYIPQNFMFYFMRSNSRDPVKDSNQLSSAVTSSPVNLFVMTKRMRSDWSMSFCMRVPEINMTSESYQNNKKLFAVETWVLIPMFRRQRRSGQTPGAELLRLRPEPTGSANFPNPQRGIFLRLHRDVIEAGEKRGEDFSWVLFYG